MTGKDTHSKLGDIDSSSGSYLERRDFLKYCSLLAAPSYLSTASILHANTSSAVNLSVGSAKLTVVSDGYMTVPMDFVLPDELVDPAEKEALLKLHDLPLKSSTTDCNITVLETENRRIVFDVGAGFNFLPTTGELAAQLEQLGMNPGTVTDVVLTHAHPDHLWGLLDDFDDLLFPEAQYHIHQQELAYWMNPNTLHQTPESRQVFVVGAQSRLPLIEDRLSVFKYGSEILPGIEAIDTSGHTPGHTSFAIHNQGDELLLLGDAVRDSIISFKRPNWSTGADIDSATAAKTRESLLQRCHQQQSTILGFHLPYPGIGNVDKMKNGEFEFLPA